ncbi:MAG: AI-2E family transporter, partial [Gemmataceae bacterium]
MMRVPNWRDPGLLRLAANAVVALAAAWWLLGQLAVVFRPLLIAVFLCYVLLPYYSNLRRRGVPAGLALGFLAGIAAVLLCGITFAVYLSLLSLADEVPRLKVRGLALFQNGTELLNEYVPWAMPAPAAEKRPEEHLADAAVELARAAVNVAAIGIVEAATAGLYLLFLMIAAEKIPTRIRAAYPPNEAEKILDVGGRINSAIVRYLKAKLLSSLMIAVPVGLVLLACGVKFALLWAVLTFLCNFIPYVGSVVAYTLPVLFAFLEFDFGWRPMVVAVLLLICHVSTAMFVEPTVLGKALGLSPLVILAALAIWGALWGLPGMFLAVPLTV